MRGKTSDPSFTHAELTAVIDYDPNSGLFTWKVKPARNVKVGAVAGSKNDPRGYTYIKVLGHEVMSSRLAWFYVNKEWPRSRVKFRNKDPRDARIDNLTLSTGTYGEFDFSTREGKIAYQRARRAQTPHLEKGRALRGSFGLSLEDYQRMHDAQGGRCAICDSPEGETRNGKVKMLAVDHCHKTGKIRGLLCCPCNQAIGKLRDDSAIIRRAADYIDRHANPEKRKTRFSDTIRGR